MDAMHFLDFKTPLEDIHPVATQIYALGKEAAFTDGFTRNNLEQTLQTPNHFVVLVKNQTHPLAFALFTCVLDEATLDYIAVRSSFQRQGIAFSLLDYAIKKLQKIGMSAIFLEVRQDNHAAIRLYEKCGFAVIQTRLNYYHHPTQNALVMKRK